MEFKSDKCKVLKQGRSFTVNNGVMRCVLNRGTLEEQAPISVKVVSQVDRVAKKACGMQ